MPPKCFRWKDNAESFLFSIGTKERDVPLCHVITSHRTLNIIASNYNKNYVLLQVILGFHVKPGVLQN